MQFRIGFGYDVHRLETGRQLILGTVKIDHDKGSVAHSDGDVLLHAICDALLGAAGLRDIGYHFPDTDNTYKGISSSILLAEVYAKITGKGYQISNIDSTIALQAPKISTNIPQMQKKIAEILHISADQVSVKATTTEKMGFEGREEGVSAYANVLIYSDFKDFEN
jgi:2-C-methyl-D-erythritol 2,4-cyclodiphosphate synthase